MGTTDDAVIAVLAVAARFVSELPVRTGCPAADVEQALARLVAAGRVLVVDHAAPDRHLVGDFRVATVTGPAAAEAVWSGFLREFLALHRCV